MPLVERVAIVALSIRFPGGQDDPQQFWEQVRTGQDCSRSVPDDRWLLKPSQCLKSGIAQPDRVYNSRGYYLDPFETNLDDLAIAPDLVQALDPLFHLILDVGRRAYRGARMLSVDPRKVGVILGNICLPTNASSQLAWEYLGHRPAEQLGVAKPQRQTHAWNRYVAGLPAGLLAKALGLGHSSFTLDAACASSLYALKLACDELLSGRADAMLAGGASRPDPLYAQMGFAQLRALSVSGRCSPFDAQADGLMVGEGAGIFVLKRLSDALKCGDQILGVICGAGLSNDQHGNLLAPAKEGQLRAMRQAYDQAEWKVTHPDIIECHATGTPVGDAIEFDSLCELWADSTWKPGQCSIGSVKSTVGHLLTGAGAAALAKVLLAMSHREKPPQANFAVPASGLAYETSPFRVLTQAEPWEPRRPTVPRRAAISGFGFGGVNAHLLVEEYVGQSYIANPAKPTSVPGEGLEKVKPVLTNVKASGRPLSVPESQLPLLSAEAPAGIFNLTGSPQEVEHEIAIVGQAVHLGATESLGEFQYRVLSGIVATPQVKVNGWSQANEPSPAGYFVEQIQVPLDRFRIPPKELEEMLPQQLLMLTTAAAALDDCRGQDGIRPEGDPTTGVYIGLGLDLNTTNFHLRWMGLKLAQESQQPIQHLAEIVDGISPALNANRTMGALGSIAASRIARAFGFGGPSFTICSEDSSSMRALELAVRALRCGELRRAIVGGVDLAGDPRALFATGVDRPFSPLGEATPLNQGSAAVAGEGSVAVVLKRLSDALQDGDQIYAVITGVGSAVGGITQEPGTSASAYASSLMRACADATVDPARIDYLEAASTGCSADDQPEAEAIAALLTAQVRPFPLQISAIRGQFGQLGAASGLAGLVKTSLALQARTLPPAPASEQLLPALAASGEGCLWSTQPSYWLTDSQPRQALVASTSIDGTVSHAVLSEYTPRPATNSTPLGPMTEGLFALEADTPDGILNLAFTCQDWIATESAPSKISSLAQQWASRNPLQSAKKRAAVLVARNVEELQEQLRYLLEELTTRPNEPIPKVGNAELRPALRDRVFYSPAPLGPKAKIAYVFPGSGNQFAHMAQELGVRWPQILDRQSQENRGLRSQYAPHRFWADRVSAQTSARECLFGQVAVGTLGADLLKLFQIRCDALIGQSLGESASLFGLRIWTDRDEMLTRIEDSTLFNSDLGPPYQAVKNFFVMPKESSVEWVSGVLPVAADDIRVALRPGLKVYLLIVTTPSECVIGGLKADVEQFVSQFSVPFLPLQGVTLAHCEVGRSVEGPYHDLHTLPTYNAGNVVVYSGASARPYRPTIGSCADSITAGLLNTIDFPAVIESAYRDGVRIFLEIGPGNSATRMIAATLEQRPFVARPLTAPRQDAVSLLHRLLAQLIAERVSVDLSPLWPVEATATGEPTLARLLTLPVGSPPPVRPAVVSDSADDLEPGPEVRTAPPQEIHTPSPRVEIGAPTAPVTVAELVEAAPAVVVETPQPKRVLQPMPTLVQEVDTPQEAIAAIVEPSSPEVAPWPQPKESATTSTNPAAQRWAQGLSPYVRAATETQHTLATAHQAFLQLQNGFTNLATQVMMNNSELLRRLLGQSPEVETTPALDPPRHLNTDQCFEFARGQIGQVLGPSYAEIDRHPTRVRLPDGPLMLVDHVLKIEGEPRSMKQGRVITDHYIHAERWYLDAGRIPTCVAVESGQADLFLSGFLGIDFITKGLAVYRLLDAVVTFHGELPGIGDRIVYDIHIDEFFHQSDTWLFRFRFEATVDGQPLMTMQNGVAGFFTAEALAAGQGIIKSRLDMQPMEGKRPANWGDFVTLSPCSLSEQQVRALRHGDLMTAFGSEFRRARLHNPMKLPGGMLKLLHRVPQLDPNGGRWSLGFIRAEYDIQPDDWFLTCHFVDDQVMPGTLMYECCLHTLRVLLMRMGWVGEEGQVVTQPVPGVSSRLKCRGQVIASTKVVAYEVSIREVGYRPEPYCLADALMYADGKPIVEITNMSLRMSGLSREALEGIWGYSLTQHIEEKPALYDKAKILSYSNGNPSEGFGEPYRIFDQGSDRVIARLPGPPYQFLDRITAVSGEPFILKAGASCEAQYYVPPHEWYFRENRCPRMPFSVLLEIALQPCGWLAAYCGSALTSAVDLSFRNLGGQGIQYMTVKPDIGTLTTNVTMTNVSQSAGMIIQHYSLKVSSLAGTVYEGTTYFGFFTKDALQNQVGMPTAKVPFLTEDQKAEAITGFLPKEPPFPGAMLRMVDQIDGYLPTGGRAGLGLVQGSIQVDPSFWFFQAHFYQDPVWPGSLGLESFLQLAKYVALRRWGAPGPRGWQTTALNAKHEWTYRGQVLPTDGRVTVVLEVTAVDEAAQRLTLDGFLVVDGRIIYQMNRFSLEC